MPKEIKSSLNDIEAERSTGHFKSSLEKQFPDIKPDILVKLQDFYLEFLATGRQISLSSINGSANAESTLFHDSISASRIIGKEIIAGQPVLDLSSTSGFAGLIFAILHPAVAVEIFDRDPRKTEYIKRVVSICGLSNISVKAHEIEQLAPGSIRNAIFRNLPLSKTLMGMRKVTPKGGRVFHIKGDTWSGELSVLTPQLFSFWGTRLLGSYKLPDEISKMNVILTEKLID